MPELSVIMPCLNEAKTIATCIGKALDSFRRLGVHGEVIVADNGSSDGSQKIAVESGARLVRQPIKGYGAALTAGLDAASGKYLIMGDADDSYDWSDIGPFLSGLREGNDVVMGNRFKGGIAPGAMPWHHRYVGNPVLSFISRVAFRIPIGDFHCGMRGFSRDAYSAMRPNTTGMEFATEMIANAARLGLRVSEVAVKLHRDGRGRPPHLRSFRDGWRHLRFILTNAPDHLYLIPGFAMLGVGLGLETVLAGGAITVMGNYLGIHFLALGGLLSLVGFNVIAMGLQSKVIISIQYPALRTASVQWALSKFKLEHALLACGFTAALCVGILTRILYLRVAGPADSMETTVHPAFAATQMLALAVNAAFVSFMLHLLMNASPNIRGLRREPDQT
jgi:glycosyltransferase involved in cell wall biosynthesis